MSCEFSVWAVIKEKVFCRKTRDMEHLERSLRQDVESGGMATEIYASPMLIPSLNAGQNVKQHREQLL
jgi:hypothetical protein